MADSFFIQLIAQNGVPAGAAAYIFHLYEKAKAEQVSAETRRADRAEELLKEARVIIDKQADAQAELIKSQVKLIEDLRHDKGQT